MSHCDIMTLPSAKACSGKCKGAACRGAPRVWVVAACEGMISLFERDMQGALVLQGDQAIFSSLDAFQKSIENADRNHAFDQLVIVGSSNDIAWIHASLPALAMHHIAAEIEYPLLPAWFKQSLPLPGLKHALESIFAT
jgi:hypothetical protein